LKELETQFQLMRVAKEDIKLAEMMFRQATKKMLINEERKAMQNQQQTIEGQIASAQAAEEEKRKTQEQAGLIEIEKTKMTGEAQNKNTVLSMITALLKPSTDGVASSIPPTLQPLVNAVIDNSAVTTAKINDSAVTTAKINNSAVTTAKINDGAVTQAKLASKTIAYNTYLGVFSTTSTTFQTVVSVSINTTGRPVRVEIGGSYISSQNAYYRITRDPSTVLVTSYLGGSSPISVPPSSLATLDVSLAAGSYQYNLECKSADGISAASADTVTIFAYEL
jgi:hypothetical protein